MALPPQHETTASGGDPAAPGADLPFSRDVIERVRALARGRGQLLAGPVTFFGMDRLRQHYGDEWSKHAERAFATVRSMMQRRLHKADICERIGNQGFLLVLADDASGMGRRRCDHLMAEISKRLIGEGEIGTYLRVESGIRPVGGKQLLASMARPRPEMPDAVVRSAAPAPPEPGPAADVPEKLKYVFRPIWNVRAKAIGSFQCWPVFPSSRDTAQDDAQTAKVLDGSTFGLDLELLAHAIASIRSAQSARRIIVVPVHGASLDNLRLRREYQEVCFGLNEMERQMIIFELLGLPEGVAIDSVKKYSYTLMHLGRALAARIDAKHPRLDEFRRAGISIVGTDLRTMPGTEADRFVWMDRFVRAAAIAGLHTFVHGLSSTSLAVAAICSGFDYVEGDAVQPIIGMPGSMSRYEVADLYAGKGG